jgi:uncharacterized SAM-binding protein YcdF (DUF218 family)
MSLPRRSLLAVALLAVVLALLWLTHPHLLRAMASWLDVGGRPHPAQYVMVLNGDEETRVLTAGVLVKEGLARGVLVTAVEIMPQDTELALPPTHEIARQVLLKRGVSSNDITILPAAATTTFDEAQALGSFLKDRPNTTVLVVTSDFHTRRSRWVFARVLGGQAAQVSVVSARGDDFRRDWWWQDEAGLSAIMSEYLKLTFYLIYYGYAGYWLAACGGLVLVAACTRLRYVGRTFQLAPENGTN